MLFLFINILENDVSFKNSIRFAEIEKAVQAKLYNRRNEKYVKQYKT